MEADEVLMKILGPHGSIDARVLHRSLGALIELLHAAAESEWVISDLAVGSIDLAVRPAPSSPDNAGDTFDRLVSGLHDLEAGTGVPLDWTDDMLHSLISLASLDAFPEVEGIQLTFGGEQTVLVSKSIVRNASRTVQFSSRSIGSVSGQIDRYISRDGKNEFGLVDEKTNKSVKVSFPRSMEGRVLAAIKHNVVAWGELTRNQAGRKVSLKLTDFELTTPRPLFDVSDAVGILGNDWTAGSSSVDWIRDQRDN